MAQETRVKKAFVKIPLATDGWRFIVPLIGVGVGLFYVRQSWSVFIGLLAFLLAGFCLYFFRDFDRTVTQDETAIIGPADGTVLEVTTIPDGEHKGRQLVRIFLSVFNVHVQRSPVSGRVDNILYKKGEFLDARHPNAHLRNEQNTVVIHNSQGEVWVTQIAGLIARRIVCWTKAGASLQQGERYGLIRFGSQVDLILPANVDILVKPGDQVRGGVSLMGRWRKT